jgi:hypothetical protein
MPRLVWLKRAFIAVSSITGILFSVEFALKLRNNSGEVRMNASSGLQRAGYGGAFEWLTTDRLKIGNSSFVHTWTSKRRRHGEFWYCRIVMKNGELAWTSSIWKG